MTTQIESIQQVHVELEHYVESIFYLKIENENSVFFENLVQENEIDSLMNLYI
jgi:uncharacterized protein YerC